MAKRFIDIRQNQRLKNVRDHLGQYEEFTDIEIYCEETVFPCHQLVLAAGSPVFRAMLNANMIEKQTKKIVIDDYKPEIVAEMLNFLYTGDVHNEILEKTAKKLLGVADKYLLDHLKAMIEEKLCSFLNVDNSIECLDFGDSHNALKLKRMALEIVAKNMKTFVDTGVISDLFTHKPALAWEVTRKEGEDRKMREEKKKSDYS